jgi:hypothetical protein
VPKFTYFVKKFFPEMPLKFYGEFRGPFIFQTLSVEKKATHVAMTQLSEFPNSDAALRRHRTETTNELELIQTQMAQKPMLRAEVGMRVRCANKASAE